MRSVGKHSARFCPRIRLKRMKNISTAVLVSAEVNCAKFRSNNNPEKQTVTQTLFRVQSRYGIFVASRHCR